jgi:uncharacterized membrane protein
MKTSEDLYQEIIKSQSKQINKLEREAKENKKIIHSMNVLLYISLASFTILSIILNLFQ